MANVQESELTAVERPSSPRIEGLRLGALQNWCETVPTSRKSLSLITGIVLLTVFGIGGTWAATAKLGGALISSGRVFAEGSNYIIQHLEGGIIRTIAIREGERVVAGQTLMELDETATRSQLDKVLNDRAVATIELARWRAERQEDLTVFSVEPESLAPVTDNPRVQEALENQIAEFQSSREARQQQLLILDGKIANEKEDIAYLEDQLRAYDSQKDLLQREEKSYVELLDKGLIRQSQVLATQRQLAQLDAQRSNALATMQKSRHNIQAHLDEKQGVLSSHAELVSQRITATQQKLNQAEDYITRLNDVLRRSKITAPVSGTIVAMPFKSIGAVIKPGEQVMEILPGEATLMMEAPINPKDITKVFVGQTVDIVFPSDQVNAIPPLEGTVSYISADSFVNSKTGMQYYVSRVNLSSNRHGRNIIPGNIAEIFFQTEAKTLLQYIIDPVTRFAMKTYTE